MNAIITPEERRLIDEAIARGRVQHVPTGATTDIQYQWDGKQLVSLEPDKTSLKAQRRAEYANVQRAKAIKRHHGNRVQVRTNAADERRLIVAKFIADEPKISAAEISRRMDGKGYHCSEATIRDDLKKIRHEASK